MPGVRGLLERWQNVDISVHGDSTAEELVDAFGDVSSRVRLRRQLGGAVVALTTVTGAEILLTVIDDSRAMGTVHRAEPRLEGVVYLRRAEIAVDGVGEPFLTGGVLIDIPEGTGAVLFDVFVHDVEDDS